MISHEQFTALAKLDSPTIANLIELTGVRSHTEGYTNHTLRALHPELPPTVGYAVTATLRTARLAPLRDGRQEHFMTRLLAAGQAIPEPRLMVFQDLDEPPRAASFGEIMATSFQRFGFIGLATSGAVRDYGQVSRLKFPCWASSLMVSHGYIQVIDINAPVTVAGLAVRPGDLLHGDANGLVKIPPQIATDILALAPHFLAGEKIVLDYLKSPQVSIEGYRAAMNRLVQAVEQLAKRSANG